MSETLELISEFEGLKTYLNDPDIDKALDNVVLLQARIFNKEAITPAQASRLVVMLSALSLQFGIKATYYKTVGKSVENSRTRMDIYKSVSFHLDKLVDSIKYLAK
jgi:hypothetical protein